MFSISSKNKGFSLTEFLVVIAVVAILSVIIFPYYFSTRKQLALQRAASKLAQDIRRAQEMAMSAKEGVPSGGYGIHLEEGDTFYIFFADNNDNHKYEGVDSQIETIELESEIKINDLEKIAIDIVFVPPNPVVYLENSLGDDTEIKISTKDGTKEKSIKVNKAGLIYVE